MRYIDSKEIEKDVRELILSSNLECDIDIACSMVDEIDDEIQTINTQYERDKK